MGNGSRQNRWGAARVFALALAVAGAVAVAAPSPGRADLAGPCTINFLPVSGNWLSAGNWDLGRAPDSTDVACIAAGKRAFTSGGGPFTVGAVLADGTLDMLDKSLTINEDLGDSHIAHLILEGGNTHLSGAFNATVEDLDLISGHFEGTGTVTIPAGGTFDVSGGRIEGSQQIVNEGTATQTGGFGMFADENRITNSAGATWTVSAGAIGGAGAHGTGGTFLNRGTVIKSGAGSSLNADARFVNAGAVEVQEGIYQPPTRAPLAGATDTGTYTVAAGAELRFAGGRTIDSGASISGDGTLRQASSTATIDGSLDVGDLIVAGGSLPLNGPATIDALTITAGTLTPVSDLTVPTVIQSGGTLNGSATLETPDLTWSGGGQGSVAAAPPADPSLIGTTRITSGGTMAITNGPSLHADREIVNDGSVDQTGGLTMAGDITNNGPWTALDATFNRDEHNPAATFNNHDTLTFSGDGGNSRAQISNGDDGTIVVPSGDIEFQRLTNLTGSTTLSHGSFDLTGTLRVDNADVQTIAGSATLIMRGPSAQLLDRDGANGLRNLDTIDGTLRLHDDAQVATTTDLATSAGGLLGGSGTVSVVSHTLTNHGTIAPGNSPGILTIDGNFAQGAGGRTEIEIGGPDPGTGFDQLAITGSAALDGTLALATINGYAPDGGYPVLTFASRGGSEFATVEDPSAIYTVVHNDIDVTATADDVTPPETTLDSHPAALSTDPSPSFEFSSSEDGSTFTCRLDGGALEDPCASPKAYTGLGDGEHTFEVDAVDVAANADPTPASFTWTIDTTAPITTLDSTPDELTTQTGASFEFSSDDPQATFECKLDDGSFAACTSPVELSGLGDGDHGFEVRATDPAGNVESPPVAFAWVVDTTAPDTSIDSGPPDPSSDSSAEFVVSASAEEPHPASNPFECKLDDGAFEACGGGSGQPIGFNSLSDGEHTLAVRAHDVAGNTDATPATYSWTIDTGGPTLTIDSGPADPANSTEATFEFSSDEPGTSFLCKLDDADPEPCTSPVDYTNLDPGTLGGEHNFELSGADAAGNPPAELPPQYRWHIDVEEPETEITGAPSDPSSSHTAAFNLNASDNFSDPSGERQPTFECNLDGAGFEACEQSLNFGNLDEGAHTFKARAIDVAGNVDSTPASYGWTIELEPETIIDSAPPARTNKTFATFQFRAEPGDSSFECKLDSAPFTACESPKTLLFLAEGEHTLAVRAVRPSGTPDPSPATSSWTVDRTPPRTTITSGPADGSSTTSGTVSFGYTSNEAGSSFACRFDSHPFAPCSSPSTASGLGDGRHSFQILATDDAGNHGPTVTRTFEVVTPCPAGTSPTVACSTDAQGRLTMIGTAAGETFVGSAGPDVIHALGGNDSVASRAGDDHVFGNNGKDTIRGGQGDDVIDGMDDPDLILGQDGADQLVGGGGADTLRGDDGGDRVSGNSGQDTLEGGGGADRIDGGGGSDSVDGGGGSDTINPGDGADEVHAGAGSDQIEARDGTRDRIFCERSSGILRGDKKDLNLGRPACVLRR